MIWSCSFLLKQKLYWHFIELMLIQHNYSQTNATTTNWDYMVKQNSEGQKVYNYWYIKLSKTSSAIYLYVIKLLLAFVAFHFFSSRWILAGESAASLPVKWSFCTWWFVYDSMTRYLLPHDWKVIIQLLGEVKGRGVLIFQKPLFLFSSLVICSPFVTVEHQSGLIWMLLVPHADQWWIWR